MKLHVILASVFEFFTTRDSCSPCPFFPPIAPMFGNSTFQGSLEHKNICQVVFHSFYCASCAFLSRSHSLSLSTASQIHFFWPPPPHPFHQLTSLSFCSRELSEQKRAVMIIMMMVLPVCSRGQRRMWSGRKGDDETKCTHTHLREPLSWKLPPEVKWNYFSLKCILGAS